MPGTAIENFGGAETGNTDEGTFTTNASVQSSVTKNSDYAVQINPATTATGTVMLFTRNPSTWANANYNMVDGAMGFHFRYGTKPGSGDEDVVSFLNGTTNLKAALTLDSTGVLKLYNQSNALIATGTTVLAADTWYWIGLQVGTGATAPYKVSINGTNELTGTASLRATNTTHIYLGKRTNRNGQTVNFYYDNWCVCSDDIPAEGYAKWAMPNATGTDNSLASGTFANVDERPASSADVMVTTGTAPNAFTVGVQDASALAVGSSDVIRAVKPSIFTRRNGATNGSILARFRSTATTSDSTAIVTGNAVTYSARVFVTDPATSAAWTRSGFDGAELGIVENSTNASQLTAAGVQVWFENIASAAFKAAWAQGSNVLIQG